MFDTHAHLEMLDAPADEIIGRAKAAGINRIAAIGSSSEANRFVTALTHPAIVKAVGFDRDHASPDQSEESLEVLISGLRSQIQTSNVHAIGETGLDFHYSMGTADQQIGLFKAQLSLARELELPVIVHSREAEADTLACLSEHSEAWNGPAGRIGLIHCFTGSMDLALKATHLGYMISFSGILTFRKAKEIRDVAAQVPEEMILVETDSPYLAPEPLRGKRNEPAYLPHTVACLAALRNKTPEEMASITEANACRLFGIA